MPTIALDGRKYFDFGIGTYIQNLISEFSGMGTTHRFALYVSPADAPRISIPEDWQTLFVPYGKYSIGEFVSFGSRIRAAGIDLFHEPHFTLPHGLKGRSVVTIHDLIHLKVPEYFSALQRAYVRFMVRTSLAQAGAVIADSLNTKNDLLELFGVPDERVTAIHCGVRPVFRRQDDNSVRRFRQARELHAPFLLYVGNVKPHKNIGMLLDAFARARAAHRDLRLVFIGGRCLSDEGLSRRARELGIIPYLKDLGQVHEDELLAAYSGAEILVLPSLYEGFGLPVLEAMACGTPTIVSTGGSLPEVAGEASISCDPHKPDAFADAIGRVLTDSALRSELVAAGAARVRQFSWQATARQTMGVYQKVLDR